MGIADQLGGIERTIGTLLEGQRNAEVGRKVIHEKQDKQDAILDEIAARLRDIAVISQMSAENVVKLTARIEGNDKDIAEIKPQVASNNEFRILAEPLVKIVRQIRLYIVALVAFFTALVGGVVAAWAFAGPVVKAVVKAWLDSVAS